MSDDGFRIATTYVRVDASDEGLRTSIGEKIKAASEGQRAMVRVDADANGLAEKVRAEAAAAHAEAHVEVKVDQKGGSVGEVVRRAVDQAAPEVEQSGEKLGESLANGLFRDSEGRLRNAAGRFASDAEIIAAGLETTGKRAQGAGGSADSASLSFGNLSTALRGAGIAAVVGLAPGLGALPGLAAMAAGGMSVLALGLKSVISVLHEAGQATAATGQSQAQLAAQAYSDMVAMRNAKQAEADAVRQAAISEQNSLDQIASANQRYQQSVAAAAQAQRDLTLAQQDAANTLADLNNSSADAALAAQSAQLQLAQAQINNQAIQNNSTKTDIEKKQSALALAQAHQAVIDTQQRATEAQQAATRANAEGVNGLPAVVSAQQRLHDSLLSVADANHAVEKANRDAANQQITSAEQVAKAQQAVIDLQKQQALAAAAAAASSGAAASKFAQDYARLTPAGKAFVDQVLSMKTGMRDLENTAQTAMLPGLTQMLRDVATLQPGAKAAVQGFGGEIGLLGARFGQLLQSPALQGQLAVVLREALGLTNQLGTGAQDLFAGVVRAGAQAAPIVTAVGAGFHDLLSMGIPNFLSGLASGGAGAAQGVQAILGFVTQLLGPIGSLVGALAGALGPALAQLLPPVAQLVAGLVHALMPAMPTLAKFLSNVAQVLGALMQVAAPVVQLLVGVLVSGLQILNPLLSGLAGFLQDNISWLGPLAAAVIGAYGAYRLFNGVVSLLQTGMGLATTAVQAFTAEGVIAQAATKAWTLVQAAFNLIMDANPIVLVTLAIAGLAAGIVWAWDHFKGFRDFVKGLPGDFAHLGDHLWDWLGSGLKASVDGVIWGINQVIHGINDLTAGASDAWTWAGVPAIPPIHDIPKLAGGGLTVHGGRVFAGERGPEEVVLPGGAQVIPNQPMTGARTPSTGTTAGGGQPININYYGTQHPTPQQKQIMLRDFALVVR